MASRNCHGRQLKWTICLSEQVATLKNPWEKLLFTWMIPTVDNLGRMEGEPYQVRGLIFPREEFATEKQIEKWLGELHEAGLIVWYSHRGLRYVFLPKHGDHQKIVGNMRMDSDFPAPSTEDMAVWTEREARYERRMNGGDTECVPIGRGREGEEEEEGEEYVDGSSTDAPPSQQVFAHWCEVMGKNGTTRFDDKRKRVVRWALANYSLDNCRAAIDGCSRSDFHMGRDPKTAGKKFNDLTLIFRDAEHVERFLEAPTVRTALEECDAYWGAENGGDE